VSRGEGTGEVEIVYRGCSHRQDRRSLLGTLVSVNIESCRDSQIYLHLK
jgi:hypothetical protein